MAITVFYSKILTPTEMACPGVIVISDAGQIDYIGPMQDAPQVSGSRLDLRGLVIVPGLIDIHVHGGHGIAFGAADDPLEELCAYSEWVVCSGVTGYLCSLAAPDPGSLVDLVERFAAAMGTGVPGAEPLGIHLEGPFVSKEKKGAFDPAWLRVPSIAETEAVLAAGQGWIRQVTLAPELPDAGQVAARFREAGVVVSLGHTNSSYQIASAALKGSFTHVTHTFNAQSGFHHREPGAFGAILTSDHITAEIIADRIHVHPGAIRVLVRCLGADRIVLITDAIAGAGLPDGTYHVVGQTIYVKDGQATLADGTLAGSTAQLNQCVCNMTRLAGVSLPEAVKMASLIPARAMGFAGGLGSLGTGREANLVAIDGDVNVRLTMVKGRVVYTNW